jgi:hypothetical protein
MNMTQGYSGFSMNDKTGEKYEEELAQELCRHYAELSGLRGTWENHWQEIAERFYPMHSNLFKSNQTQIQAGDKRNKEILDSTGVLGLSRFGAILDSLLTPRNQFWHQLKPSDRTLLRDKNTMDWFSKVNTILFEQRYAPRANFASQNQLVYKSLGSYGTAALLIDDLAGQPGFRYKNVHLSELYLQENHQGIVDRVCRHFVLTARQAMQKFGNRCPKTIQDKAKLSPEAPFMFLHWVLPRTDKDPARKDFKGMDFASYYISMTEKKIVSEGGYRAFPYCISRYEQAPQEAYGRSPAMDALPAMKTLNEQKKVLLKQGQLAVDPVILVNDDGIMDGAQVEAGTYISGAVNADGRPLLQVLPSGRVEIGKDLMDDERAIINDTFLVTLFQILVETPEMTATEVIERTREKGILLAPTIGRQQSEYLGPMIERELDLGASQGLFPPMPRFLKEAQGEYSVIYDSPITRTQKAEWASGAVRTIETLMNVAVQTQDPTPLYYINFDIAAPQIAEIYGTPAEWINSPEQVAQMKAALAQQKQVQTMIDAAPAVAGMMKASK